MPSALEAWHIPFIFFVRSTKEDQVVSFRTATAKVDFLFSLSVFFFLHMLRANKITWILIVTLFVAVCLPMDHKATKHNKREWVVSAWSDVIYLQYGNTLIPMLIHLLQLHKMEVIVNSEYSCTSCIVNCKL